MKRLLNILLPSIIIFLLYYRTVNYGFIAIDDGAQVLENPFLNSLSWQNLKDMFSSDTVEMYQPLTTLLLALVNISFGHAVATPFHLVSIALHILNAALVYFVGKRLFPKVSHAVILSLLFAVHPIAVESVCWVSATSTLLFTSFFLAATLCYDCLLAHGKSFHYFAALIFFTLGCFVKIQILPFVGVIFLLDGLRGDALIDVKRLMNKVPFIAVAAFFVVLSLHFRGGQSGFTGNYNSIVLFPAQISWYVVKALMPFNLGVVYDWPANPWTFWPISGYGILLVIGYLIYRFRKNKLFVFGVLFFLGNIILHTSIFSSFLGPYADRYGYLSILGLWIALLSLVRGIKPATLSIISSVVIVSFVALAAAQTQHWRDTISLWTNNLKHQSATFSNGMRGALYYERGKLAQAKRDFEKVDRNPDFRFEPDKYNYLYTALGVMTTDSEPQNSLRYFQKAADWLPHPSNYENVALAAKKVKEYVVAEEYYLKCPKDFEPPSYYLNLSSLYFETQQFRKGANIMTEAIEAGYENILCFKMRCYFHIETGEIKSALEDFDKAVKLFESSPDKTPDPILNNLRMMLTPYM